LRVDEALGADIADLGTDRGHQVLTVLGKGNRRSKVALTTGTLSALHLYLEHRAAVAGSTGWRGMGGPLLATTSGGRMRPSQLWELVRRLAADAGIAEWDRLSPHSLRHTGITLALDAGCRCVMCRTTPAIATPAQRDATTIPATVWTAPRPTLSPPISPERPTAAPRHPARPAAVAAGMHDHRQW
jgi:integrase